MLPGQGDVSTCDAKDAQGKCAICDYVPNQWNPCEQAMLGGQLTCSQLVGAYLQVNFRFIHAWQHSCGLLSKFLMRQEYGKFPLMSQDIRQICVADIKPQYMLTRKIFCLL